MDAKPPPPGERAKDGAGDPTDPRLQRRPVADPGRDMRGDRLGKRVDARIGLAIEAGRRLEPGGELAKGHSGIAARARHGGVVMRDAALSAWTELCITIARRAAPAHPPLFARLPNADHSWRSV